jgi:putative endonuclease
MYREKQYYVYIMTNRSGTLYVGVTNNIKKRIYQHKNKLVEGFTKKYNIDMLIYYETFSDVRSAISREKLIKVWLRSKKIDLINTTNPDWTDLSKDWFD